MSEQEPNPPEWLSNVLSQLQPPKHPSLVDPNDLNKVLDRNQMNGCCFDHEDGLVSMAVYIPCADPDTKEAVGLAVIFLGDDMRMYSRAESIQGVHLEEAQRSLVDDYLTAFHRPTPKSQPGAGR
ncbi:MAG: hypothetical protein V7693_15955 [Halopseudomonas sabulinigri]